MAHSTDSMELLQVLGFAYADWASIGMISIDHAGVLVGYYGLDLDAVEEAFDAGLNPADYYQCLNSGESLEEYLEGVTQEGADFVPSPEDLLGFTTKGDN